MRLRLEVEKGGWLALMLEGLLARLIVALQPPGLAILQWHRYFGAKVKRTVDRLELELAGFVVIFIHTLATKA